MDNKVIKERAVKLFGNEARLAEALGITRQAVNQWGQWDPIPERHALKIIHVLKPEEFKK